MRVVTTIGVEHEVRHTGAGSREVEVVSTRVARIGVLHDGEAGALDVGEGTGDLGTGHHREAHAVGDGSPGRTRAAGTRQRPAVGHGLGDRLGAELAGAEGVVLVVGIGAVVLEGQGGPEGAAAGEGEVEELLALRRGLLDDADLGVLGVGEGTGRGLAGLDRDAGDVLAVDGAGGVATLQLARRAGEDPALREGALTDGVGGARGERVGRVHGGASDGRQARASPAIWWLNGKVASPPTVFLTSLMAPSLVLVKVQVVVLPDSTVMPVMSWPLTVPVAWPPCSLHAALVNTQPSGRVPSLMA